MVSLDKLLIFMSHCDIIIIYTAIQCDIYLIILIYFNGYSVHILLDIRMNNFGSSSYENYGQT